MRQRIEASFSKYLPRPSRSYPARADKRENEKREDVTTQVREHVTKTISSRSFRAELGEWYGDWLWRPRDGSHLLMMPKVS